MAFIGNQVTVKGVIYTPQSSDPLNPKEGQQFFSDGTIRAKGLWVYKDSNWSQVGAGVSDKSVYAQFDAEDQSTTSFINISVSGSGAINQDNSYIVDSFPASIPSVDLNPRNKNKENSTEFHYTLISGTAKAVVKDQTATVISEVELEATNDPQKVILSHFVNGTMSSLTLEFQDVSSATSLKVDDIIFSDDPFVYKNLSNDTEPVQYVPTNTQGFGTLNTNAIRWHREGAFMVVSGNFVSGTVDGNEAQIELPDSLVIGDVGVAGGPENVGTFAIDTSTNTNGGIVLATAGDTFINFSTQSVFGAATVVALNPIAGNNVIGSGGEVSFNAKIRIEGWKVTTEHVITPSKSSETVEQFLNADVTASGNVGDLQFNNLIVGNKYFLSGTVRLRSTSNGNPRLDFYSGTGATGTLYGSTSQTGGSVNLEHNFAVSLMFTATSETMYTNANAAGTSIIRGSGTKLETHLQLTNITSQFLAAIPVQRTAYIKDIKPNNTDSGTFTSGADRTRDLTIIQGDSSFVSLSSNQFTLPAGTYDLSYSAPAHRVDRHQAKLYNITDSIEVPDGLGTGMFAGAGDGVVTRSEGKCTLILETSTVFEIRHECQTTRSGDGFGERMILGNDEVYTTVKITKIK